MFWSVYIWFRQTYLSFGTACILVMISCWIIRVFSMWQNNLCWFQTSFTDFQTWKDIFVFIKDNLCTHCSVPFHITSFNIFYGLQMHLGESRMFYKHLLFVNLSCRYRTGDTVYVGTEDSRLLVYSVDTGKCLVSIDHDVGAVSFLQLSRDGRYMIVAGQGRVHIEDLQCKLTVQLINMQANGYDGNLNCVKTSFFL